MFPSVSRRRKRGAAAVLLATTAAIPAFAVSAQATIAPSSDWTEIHLGQVTLDTVPFGLVGPADAHGKSFSFKSGEVKFTWYQGKVAAHLTGTLHVDGAKNAQARVHVDSLTGNNEVLDTVYDAKAGTPINSPSQDVNVDLDVPAQVDLRKIKIVLEEKSNTPDWVDRGEYYAQFITHSDDVTILGPHLDVGGSQWDKGAPLSPAGSTWKINDDGSLTATYRGFLHFQGFAGSARVQVRSIDPLTGFVSASADGKTWSSNGAGHERFPTDVSVAETIPLTSFSPTRDVVIQSWVSVPGEAGGGHWDDVGSQRISAGD